MSESRGGEAGAASCCTVTARVAMVIAAVRVVPLLAAAVKLTVPDPVRVAGPPRVSQDAPPEIDHVQALPVFTVKGSTAPPPLVTAREVGVTS